MTTTEPDPERWTTDAIQRHQVDRLRSLLAEIVPRNRFWTKVLSEAGVDVSSIRSLGELRQLPLTSKQQLVEDQAQHQPYGTNLTYDLVEYSRMHQTSGTTGVPMRWLDTPASWNWFLECWAQIYRFAEVDRQDRICFPFSFGPFVGFWAAFDGANRLGNLCLPGGGMTSQARLQLISENQASVICCTPTYALRLAEVASEQGIDLAGGSVQKLIVAGEPGGAVPAVRNRIERAWGARLFDHWGMTEIGSLAIECVQNSTGLHLLETECIPEIIDPQTTEPVEPGQQGELVITNLGRLSSPLIRYRTGDLVQADLTPCACGRESLRLKGGVLGRTDDMVTIRGNNVFPSSIEAIIREFDAIKEFRIEVKTLRSMSHMKIEIEPSTSDLEQVQELIRSITQSIKDRLNFQAEVTAVDPGALPRFELKARRFFRS